jgi:amidase
LSSCDTRLDRRELLRLALLGLVTQVRCAHTPAARGRGSLAAGDEDCQASIAQLQAGLQSGRWTSRRLVERCLERIEALDRRGPTLRAMLALNPDALSIAARCDAERAAGRSLGPLHGIPIVIKDNIDTGDRMPTTAGSLALEGSLAARDAFVVARLRSAGAVLLGKTNLSEWANLRSTRSTHGWSALGGLSRNPYALDRSACGSSTGTAVAVSAGYVAAGVGTETDGSILCPSSTCGLVGLKPTVGLISRGGMIPISSSQDTPGPMARSVEDVAVLLQAMAGVDPADPACAARPREDYRRALSADGLKGARLGVARKFFGVNPQLDRLMEQALAVLRSAGATLVDPADLPTHGKLEDLELVVLLYELKAGLDAYLAARRAPVKSLAEVIAFNEAHADRELRFFGQDLFLKAQAKGPLSSLEYLQALEACRRLSRREGLDAILGKERLDALVAPTGGSGCGPTWTTDLINGDPSFGGVFSWTPAAVAGYPSITVPAGSLSGLPVGISFLGAAWSEATLLRLAYAFEQATHHRRTPRLLPTLEL